MTYDFYGESNLVGNIVGTVQVDDTTIKAQMRDNITGLPRAPLASTKLFQIGVRTKRFETFSCESHSTDADGITTFANCTRWLPSGGADTTAGEGTEIHLAGDSIVSAPSHTAINTLLEIANGIRKSGAHQYGLAQVAGEDYVTYGYYNDSGTFVGMFRRKVADTKIAEFFGSDDEWHNLQDVGAHGSESLIKQHADVHADASDSPSDMDIMTYDSGDGKWKPMNIGEIMGNSAEAAYSFDEDEEASDAYAITLSPAPSALVDGREYRFKANTANTGAATLNINSLGAKTIKKNNDRDLEDGDIEAGQIISVVYNADDDVFEWQGSSAGGLTRAQVVALTGGGNADDEHTHGSFAFLQTTRAANAAAGSVVIPHGLGRIPKYITVVAQFATGQLLLRSDGFYNGSVQRCSHTSIYDQVQGETYYQAMVNSTSHCLKILMNSEYYPPTYQQAVATFDGTNITLTFTKGSRDDLGTENIAIQIFVHA